MLSIYLGFNLSGPIKSFLNFAFKVWNKLMNMSFDMLIKLPSDLKKGKDFYEIDGMVITEILKHVNEIFVGVATSLLVLFFVIGFCQETVNVRDEMRFDSIVKYLVRLCMAEYFTVNSMTILIVILKCCKNFCKLLKKYFRNGTAKLEITARDEKLIENCGFCYQILLLMIAFLVGCLVIIMAFSILYTTCARMLKILLLIPFGSLAFSTMGGGGEVGRVCVSYLKYFMAIALEAVTISTALIFGSALMKFGTINLGYKAGWLVVLEHLISMLFQAAILTGTVKSAEHITREMIGH